MGLTKEEAEIQCDWATALGLGTTGPEDGDTLIRVCGVGHRRDRNKNNGGAAQENVQQGMALFTGGLDWTREGLGRLGMISEFVVGGISGQGRHTLALCVL